MIGKSIKYKKNKKQISKHLFFSNLYLLTYQENIIEIIIEIYLHCKMIFSRSVHNYVQTSLDKP